VRAFVTGAPGFVGLNLVAELIDRGFEVVALHRDGADLRQLSRHGVRLAAGPITESAAVERAMPERVDAVFHVAGDTNMWSRRNAEQFRANVEGTRNVVRAALARGARRVVHTSSIAAYGIHPDPIDERTPQLGRDSWIHYLRTKALAEDEVRAAVADGLDAVIVNPANVLGPYDERNWARMIRRAATGRLPAVPPGRGSFCHVREVARAHVAALERGRTGENYLLGGADASYLDLVREVCALVGSVAPPRAIAPWKLKTYARFSTWSYPVTGRRPVVTPETAALGSASMVCRDAKAVRELGHRPVPLRDMLADCLAWLRSEGALGRS
jgi:nucleoside-diphosphate-sugar epimerase